jgi:alanine dehydrogenase
MIIGIPREVKDHEYRIALTPGCVRDLVDEGHRVLVEAHAGVGSGFADSDYRTAGAEIVPGSADAWSADLVVKVKEPQPSEYALLRPDLLLFTYLHLAADEQLTHTMLESGVTGIAYETVELPSGELPLLTPMSEVAGRIAIQIGAHYLEKKQGGRGVLPGGVPGVHPATVVIVGGGVVGINAAQMALGMGAQVFLLDKNVERLRYLDTVLHGRVITVRSNALKIANLVQRADLLVGAVLLKGARAPRLVTREMVRTMPPGSVVIDVAVDQGGCIETTRPTTHSEPVYVVDDVLHYCVTNMPAAVPRTSTFALSNATIPYVMSLARLGFTEAVRNDDSLARGVNTYKHAITCAPIADTFGMSCTPLRP